MNDIRWEKQGEMVFARTECSISRPFTVAELQEGLRVAQEKPVFTATNLDGRTVEIKKQVGYVAWRWNGEHVWTSIEKYPISSFSDSELEAVLKARRS